MNKPNFITLFNPMIIIIAFMLAFAGINNLPLTINPIPIWGSILIFILIGAYLLISIWQLYKWINKRMNPTIKNKGE